MDENSIEKFLAEAKQGKAEAQYRLGELYDRHPNLNYKEAAKWYQRAAEQGHADAQNELAWLYGNGLGVPQSHNKAAFWFHKAAVQGHEEAKQHSPTAIEAKRTIELVNIEVELNRLLHLSRRGNVKAQCDLAKKCIEYCNNEKDAEYYEKMLRWLQKAFVQGYSEARPIIFSLVQEKHKQYIISTGKNYKGSSQRKTKLQRVTHCYNCKGHLDNNSDLECLECGWIICTCGACGCGYEEKN